MNNLRQWRTKWAIWLACAALPLAGPSNSQAAGLAAPPASPARQPNQPGQPPREVPFPSIEPVFKDRLPAVEKEVAALIMRRSDTSPARLAQLEISIDLRIIERWLIQQTIATRAETPEQIAALLRADQLTGVIAEFEEAVKQPSGAPTASQSDATAKLHQLTYDLKSEGGAGAIDEACRQAAVALANIVNPTAIDPSQIPEMRPKRIDRRKDQPTDPAEQRSLATLSDEITHAAVSVPVRSQLLALLSETQAAQKANDKEAGKLQAVLADAVDLAMGLAGNVAISAQTKAEIESDFAEGLALFSDARTRPSGQRRIQGLAQYRQMISRITRMKLTPDLRKRLAPAIAWAQNHIDQGGRMLGVIDQYVETVGQYDALPKTPVSMPNLRKSTDDAAKAFELKRDQFLTNVGELGGTGFTTVTPDSLDNTLAEMRVALELYQTIAGMPQAIEVLVAYKPKPSGGLESRVVKSAVLVTAGVKSPTSGAARAFLVDVYKLARSAEAVGLKSTADLPPAVMTAWAGGPLNAFEMRCRAMVTELASQAAGGQELDAKKLARLDAAPQLIATLRGAAALESILARIAPLQRWVDWDFTPEAVRAMLAPYQQAVGAAFSGFISDTPDAVEKFLRSRGQYTALMAMVGRDAAYIEACALLPSGLAGSLARLATPLEGRPFGTERYVSYALKISSLYSATDLDASRAAAAAALKRLARDIKPAPEEEFGPALPAKPKM